ncbi:helix-turn-helix transcriptional regulator [Enterococcus sp. LJL128]|uniref:helix-turn-helix transcriptional regulator n=1 Tax=Enterococcus sp. LJL51 TaxID=3416656 RepID=UPI003CF94B4B
MKISEQLKKHRKIKQLSQEGLAEVVHVSRQTVSNWETGRSYPDLQSLLLLSDYFEVSLDELVRGDVPMMKKTVEVRKMNHLAWVMCGGFILMIALMPLVKYYGWLGAVGPAIGMSIMLGAAVAIERLKKKHDVQTYSEILSFMENKEMTTEQVEKERRHLKRQKWLLALGSGILTIILLYIVLKIF